MSIGRWGNGDSESCSLVKLSKLVSTSFIFRLFYTKVEVPSYTSLTSFSARKFNEILNYTCRSLVFRKSLRCDWHLFKCKCAAGYEGKKCDRATEATLNTASYSHE